MVFTIVFLCVCVVLLTLAICNVSGRESDREEQRDIDGLAATSGDEWNSDED